MILTCCCPVQKCWILKIEREPAVSPASILWQSSSRATAMATSPSWSVMGNQPGRVSLCVYVCVREMVCVCVCVCDRKFVCVCVCERERDGVCMCVCV